MEKPKKAEHKKENRTNELYGEVGSMGLGLGKRRPGRDFPLEKPS